MSHFCSFAGQFSFDKLFYLGAVSNAFCFGDFFIVSVYFFVKMIKTAAQNMMTLGVKHGHEKGRMVTVVSFGDSLSEV